jgi:hypothetical protein
VIKKSSTTETKNKDGKLLYTITSYELENPIKEKQVEEPKLKTNPNWKQVLEFVFPFILIITIISISLMGIL